MHWNGEHFCWHSATDTQLLQFVCSVRGLGGEPATSLDLGRVTPKRIINPEREWFHLE